MKLLRPTIALSLAFALAACGSVSKTIKKVTSDKFEDQSGTEILTDAYDSMATLTSVHIVGFANDAASGDISMDLSIDDAGYCNGWVNDGNGKLELLINADHAYIKATPKVIRTSMQLDAQTAKVLGNKWLLLPADGSAEFTGLCTLDNFLGDIGSEDMVGSATAGDVVDFEGEQVVAVVNPVVDGGTETNYVQIDGDHFVVRVFSEELDEDLAFTEFNEEFDFADPPQADIFDLSK